jgi:hypothetical protein
LGVGGVGATTDSGNLNVVVLVCDFLSRLCFLLCVLFLRLRDPSESVEVSESELSLLSESLVELSETCSSPVIFRRRRFSSGDPTANWIALLIRSCGVTHLLMSIW